MDTIKPTSRSLKKLTRLSTPPAATDITVWAFFNASVSSQVLAFSYAISIWAAAQFSRAGLLSSRCSTQPLMVL